MSDEPTVIQASHYKETEDRLTKDTTVMDMAQELIDGKVPLYSSGFLHENGSPTFNFMQKCSYEYHRRGGRDGGHIGAIANAVIRLVKASEQK